MLPFAGFLHIKVRCPHCKKDEIRWRVSTAVGVRHTCPFCRREYRVAALLPLATAKARRS